MPKLNKEIQSYMEGKGNLDLIYRMIVKGYVFQDDIKQCYTLLAKNVNNEMTYALIRLLKGVNKEWHDYTLMAEALNCSEKTTSEIINNQSRAIYFPIVEAQIDRCKMSELLVIPLSEENLFLNKEMESDLHLIHRLADKKYFVAFEYTICDESYMLALYTALVADDEYYLKKYTYSGGIKADGYVNSVSKLELKKECSLKSGYRLVYGGFNISTYNRWINDNKTPVPLVILFDRAAAEGIEVIGNNIYNVIRRSYNYFSYELLEQFYDLKIEDLLLLEPKPLPLEGNEWVGFITEKVRPIVDKILKNVPADKRVFQVFGSNAILLFGIGTLLREYYPFQGYHFYNGGYYPVVTNGEDIRGMKKRLNPEQLTLTECKIEGQKDVMLVNVYLASHRPDFASRKFLDKQGVEYGTADIALKIDQGNIDFNQSWLPYVNELYNHLNLIFERSKQVHLFMSCPVVIAFALGVAVGHYWDITAYQYDLKNKTYFKAFNLNEI